MPTPKRADQLTSSGPFLTRKEQRVQMHWVTYGPFPPRPDGAHYPDPEQIARDLSAIRQLGFDGIRLYSPPPSDLLELAEQEALSLAAGLSWVWSDDFLCAPDQWRTEMVHLIQRSETWLKHPSIELIYVANEIPADLVRWMGPHAVKEALDWLIGEVQARWPHKLVGYASYPSTEYLQPDLADFSGINLYLESASDLDRYLQRLALMSADRPLIVSEFGLDSHHRGEAWQASRYQELLPVLARHHLAGLSIYAWSDTWWNQQRLISDWAFGLVRRDSSAKPSLPVLKAFLEQSLPCPLEPSVSVIICTHNGAQTLEAAIQSLLGQSSPADEIIVIDDGSKDASAEIAKRFPQIHYQYQNAAGLSVARNLGADLANSLWVAYMDDDCQAHPDWILEIRRHLASSRAAAIGGPNIPPPSEDWQKAQNAVAPGAASHVMLNDQEAEHLPGCNLIIKRDELRALGGFDPRFRTAGDDVDLCWRFLDTGARLEFCPHALVWHQPRPSIGGYFKQQWGYGKAEALLREKHPERFNEAGSARWQGHVYESTTPARALSIYHGPQASSPFQWAEPQVQPRRAIEKRFRSPKSKRLRRLIAWLQIRVRLAARDGTLAAVLLSSRTEPQSQPSYQRRSRRPLSSGEDRISIIERLARQPHWQKIDHPRWDLKGPQGHVALAEVRHQDGSRELLIGRDYEATKDGEI